MRALLVVNPHSRRGRRLGKVVRADLTRRGVEVVEKHDAQPIDAIVAAGGDGTLAPLIARAIALRVPIGLVPLGTFNELARTLEIPFDVGEACDAIAAGRTRTIDVARVNGAYYTNEASIGISSRLARLQRPVDKQRFGLLGVAMSALGALGQLGIVRPFRVELAYAGTTARFKAIQLTVANSHRFGGFVSVDGAGIDDGWLDCYAVEIESFRDFLGVAGAIVTGRRRPVPGLRTYRATAFTVTTHHPHRITADGEPAGKTPATFEIVPNALRVFVPPAKTFRPEARI
ncbi:MAG: YegS/Rv2252/BmrU family lipid kinase [Candidatus Baltobacteraceae bacterium]